MSTHEFTSDGRRLIEVTVEPENSFECDVAVHIRDGALSYTLFLTQDQAVQVGSDLCATALTARDRTMVMPVRLDDWRDRDVLDTATGQGRR